MTAAVAHLGDPKSLVCGDGASHQVVFQLLDPSITPPEQRNSVEWPASENPLAQPQECYATFWDGCDALALSLWEQFVGPGCMCCPAEFERIVNSKLQGTDSIFIDVNELFTYVDLDGDGQVSRHEFLVWAVQVPPNDTDLFQESLQARIAVAFALANRIRATDEELQALFSSISNLPLSPGARLHDLHLANQVPDQLPDLPLITESGRTQRPSKICGATSMAAWALCPLVSLENRIKVLRAVAASDDAWDFAGLLALATLCEPGKNYSIAAASFEALPPVVSKRGFRAQEAAMHSATIALMEQIAPTSFEFGMMIGLPDLSTSVTATAPACIGRVLRFYKMQDLGTRYPADLPSNHGIVVDCIRRCLPKDSMSCTSENVQASIAEIIYGAIKEGDERIAKLLMAHLAQVLSDPEPDLRASGVQVLTHVATGVPTLRDAWGALIVSVVDPDVEIHRLASMYIGSQMAQKSAALVSETVAPLLQEMFGQVHVQSEARMRIMEIAAITASGKLSNSASSQLTDLALSALNAGETGSLEIANALQILTNLGVPAHERAVPTILLLLQQYRSDICLPLCKALVAMLPPGNTEAIGMASAALKRFDGPETTRAEITNCLASLAEIDGDDVASAVFLYLLATFPGSVRCTVASLCALGSTARAGHPEARLAALAQVDLQASPEIIIAAVVVLKKVCPVGDAGATDSLLKLLGTEITNVHPPLVAEIINALSEICSPGDTVVLAALRQQLSRGWWPIRITTLQSIKTLAPAFTNSSEAKAIVLGCLRDAHPDVRECAVEVLASVAPTGDSESIAALSAMREEGQPVQVDEAIEEALETLSEDMLSSPLAIALPYTHTSREHTATSETSFQLIDGTSNCSFQVVDGTFMHSAGGSSENSFQIIAGSTAKGTADE